jgi:hypothetical protein
MDTDEPLDRDIYCRHCYYCLRGLVEDRCPECGRTFNRRNASTFSLTPPPSGVQQAMRRLYRLLPGTDRTPAQVLAQLRQRNATGALAELQTEFQHLAAVHQRLVELLLERQLVPEEVLVSLVQEAEVSAPEPAIIDDQSGDVAPTESPQDASADLVELARAFQSEAAEPPELPQHTLPPAQVPSPPESL